MTIFDEISPVLAYLLLIPLVIAIIWREWKVSEAERKRRKRQAAAFDAQRQRWLTRKDQHRGLGGNEPAA